MSCGAFLKCFSRKEQILIFECFVFHHPWQKDRWELCFLPCRSSEQPDSWFCLCEHWTFCQQLRWVSEPSGVSHLHHHHHHPHPDCFSSAAPVYGVQNNLTNPTVLTSTGTGTQIGDPVHQQTRGFWQFPPQQSAYKNIFLRCVCVFLQFTECRKMFLDWARPQVRFCWPSNDPHCPSSGVLQAFWSSFRVLLSVSVLVLEHFQRNTLISDLIQTENVCLCRLKTNRRKFKMDL